MDANLAGFVALGVLIVGLFAWLRQEICSWRNEIRCRVEMRSEINGLRCEFRGETEALRNEMCGEVKGLRR